jgi:hypothetical protein
MDAIPSVKVIDWHDSAKVPPTGSEENLKKR